MASPIKFGEHQAVRSSLFAIAPQALVVDWSKNLSRNGEEPPVDEGLMELARDMVPRGDASEEEGSSGQINPITVRMNDDGLYEVICGFRRMRAALWLVESGTCPDFKIRYDVKRMSDAEAALVNMSENLQREEPKQIQTAHAIRRLHEDYGMPITRIAERLKKSDTWCHNLLRLVRLPQCIQDEVENENLPVTAAVALSRIEGEEAQIEAYDRVKEEGGRVTAGRFDEQNPGKTGKADKAARGPLGKFRKMLEKKVREFEGGAVLAEMILQFLDDDEVSIDELETHWDATFEMATNLLRAEASA